MFRCTPPLSSTAIAVFLPLALLGAGCPGEEEGGFVQVDPPNPNLNEGNGLPFEVDEDPLYQSLNADQYYNVLCAGNQGFGDYYSFDEWQCSGDQLVAYIRWNTTDGVGELTGTDDLFLVESTSHGTLEGNAVVDLPLDTLITVEGIGGLNDNVGRIQWMYTLDGAGEPVVVDLLVDGPLD